MTNDISNSHLYGTKLLKAFSSKYQSAEDENQKVTQQIYQFENSRFDNPSLFLENNSGIKQQIREEICKIKFKIKSKLKGSSLMPIMVQLSHIGEENTEKIDNGENERQEFYKFCHDPKSFIKFKTDQNSPLHLRNKQKTMKEKVRELTRIKTMRNSFIDKQNSSQKLKLPKIIILPRHMRIPNNSKALYKSVLLKPNKSLPNIKYIQKSTNYISKLIEQCKSYESLANTQLRKNQERIYITKLKAENFQNVSERISRLEYANPRLLEYLYFQQQNVDEFLETEAKERLNRPKSKLRFIKSVKRIRKDH